MRGQYSHNHRVWINNNSHCAEAGRATRYRLRKDKVATPFYGAGYRTGLFGKYLNGYYKNTVSHRLDAFYARCSEWREIRLLRMNDHGIIKSIRLSTPATTVTDVLKVADSSSSSTRAWRARKPFFAYVAVAAPHKPFTLAPRVTAHL